jgi:hypothetical protein
MLISIKIDLATTITICGRPPKEHDSISVVSRRSLHHAATRSRRRLAQRLPSPDRSQALLAAGTVPPHHRSKPAR